MPFFRERQIWWSYFGTNIGHEQNGKGKEFMRPALIIKKFNKDLFLGIPQSTQDKKGKYYVSYKLDGRKYTFLLSQIRVMSTKRLKKHMTTLDSHTFFKIILKLIGMLTVNIFLNNKSR